MKKHTSTNHRSATSRSIVLVFWFGVVGLLSLGAACYGDVEIVKGPALGQGDTETDIGGNLRGPGEPCSVDDTRCTGALLEHCKGGVLGGLALPHWEPIEDCHSAKLCDPTGSCLAPKCAANAMRCEGAVPWTCSDDLTERLEQTACINAGHCSLVDTDCAAENKQAPCCLKAPCTAGDLRCNGGQIERCRDDQEGRDPVGDACATQALCEGSLATCQPGSSCVCKPPECEKGAARCTGAILERCNADQTGWEFAEECGTQKLCEIGQERHEQAGPASVVACEPETCADGGHHCTGGTLEVCNADRTGFDFVQACDGGAAFCDSDGGVCAGVPCNVGETRCSGAQIERCKADRTGFEAVSGDENVCDTPQLCIKTGQAPAFCKPPTCPPNQTICTGNQLQRCNAGQDGFNSVGPACPRPDLCSAQRQRCDFCVPNQRECTPDLRSSRTCGPDGNSFGQLTFCPLGCIPANGTCNTCPVGQYTCQGGLLSRCNDGFSFTALNRAADCSGQNRVSCNGNQLQTSPCGTLGCNTQRLACNDCAAPQRRCVDTENFQSCQANGTFSAPTDCGEGLLCVGTGQCACTAGQASCDGDALLVCNGTGTGFVAGSRCSGAGGNVLRTCSDGELTTNTCASGALCTAATGASCPACTEGEGSCLGGQPQVCVGGQRVPAAACAAGLVCEGAGLCRCTAGDVRCTAGALVQCAANRQSFEPAAACDGATLRGCSGNTRSDQDCGSAELCQASGCAACLDSDPPACTDAGTELRCVGGQIQESECGIDLCFAGIGCILPTE